MRLINRSSKKAPLARKACDAALAQHLERFGEYGRQYKITSYTVLVGGVKVTVEVVNRPASYVATGMIGARRLRGLVAERAKNNYRPCQGLMESSSE